MYKAFIFNSKSFILVKRKISLTLANIESTVGQQRANQYSTDIQPIFCKIFFYTYIVYGPKCVPHKFGPHRHTNLANIGPTKYKNLYYFSYLKNDEHLMHISNSGPTNIPHIYFN